MTGVRAPYALGAASAAATLLLAVGSSAAAAQQRKHPTGRRGRSTRWRDNTNRFYDAASCRTSGAPKRCSPPSGRRPLVQIRSLTWPATLTDTRLISLTGRESHAPPPVARGPRAHSASRPDPAAFEPDDQTCRVPSSRRASTRLRKECRSYQRHLKEKSSCTRSSALAHYRGDPDDGGAPAGAARSGRCGKRKPRCPRPWPPSPPRWPAPGAR